MGGMDVCGCVICVGVGCRHGMWDMEQGMCWNSLARTCR